MEAAARRIALHIRRTPILTLRPGELGLPCEIVLKLEFLQHAGSFKTRGAFNNLLSRDAGSAGVAAASGGNHGAAVAYAAQRLGQRATIFVPEISAPAKIDAIRRFGADVRIGGQRYDDAQAACDHFVTETGALKIHPFAAAETMAGQGTTALEWDEQLAATGQPPMEMVLVAAGGGGLVSGMAAWWAGSATRVIAVEPEGSRALHAALAAGGPVEVSVNSIAADSLGAKNVGALVHQVAAATVDHVALVPDDAIRAAQALLWRELRIASEPGGAAALAALICGVVTPTAGRRIGVLLCGANVDPAALPAAA